MALASSLAPQPGDHLCGFYYGDEERDALLLPFLRAGLRSGDKCLAVVDSTPVEQVIAEVTTGLDAEALLASGQLELYGSAQTYLLNGSFEPDRMIDFWERMAVDNSAGESFGFARVVGEMSWLERAPAPREHVLKYETWADGFATRFEHAILCLYDLRRLGSGILLDLMRTHPKLLLGGLVLENPHHLSTDPLALASA
jgi:hypothetical protein